LTTDTDAPTVLVSGGSLTLRNDVIQESTGFTDAAVSVTGGSVDLGTTGSRGGNTLNVNGPGEFVHTTNAGSVPADGNTLEADGVPVAAPYLSFTSLASSGTTTVYGQSVTLTASVRANTTPGSGTPTGSVNFFDVSTNTDLGSAPLSGGSASLTTAALGAGSHLIRASYSGDDQFTVSLDALTQTVNVATPTIAWAPTAITYGTPLSGAQLDAAAVWTVGGSAVTVRGTFTYAPAAGTMLHAGSHTLTAHFVPDDAADYTPADQTVSLTVNPAPLTATAVSFAATAGAPFSGTVATFTNTDPLGGAACYTAVITWGDGSTSNGVISGAGGLGSTLTVTGSHTYADPINGAVQVTICHNLGDTTTATVSGTATVTSLGQAVVKGTTGGIGFWKNASGQALIQSFGNTATGLTLGQWLATTFSNLYGAGANDLTGASNAQVAAYFQTLFSLGGTQVQAQTLALALNVYATTSSLGGSAGVSYGFTVSATGLGARFYNLGKDGAAFGVANNTTLNVYQLLRAVNKKAVNGLLYDGDATLQALAADLFNALNKAGGIG
jgi:hypothetical protein